MAKEKNGRSRRSGTEDKGLKALYAKHRKEFTAADLQKFTEIEPGIPAATVLAEMEAIQRRLTRRRKK